MNNEINGLRKQRRILREKNKKLQEENERLNNIIDEIESIVYADMSNIDVRISIQEKLDKLKSLKEGK